MHSKGSLDVHELKAKSGDSFSLFKSNESLETLFSQKCTSQLLPKRMSLILQRYSQLFRLNVNNLLWTLVISFCVTSDLTV